MEEQNEQENTVNKAEIQEEIIALESIYFDCFYVSIVRFHIVTPNLDYITKIRISEGVYNRAKFRVIDRV